MIRKQRVLFRAALAFAVMLVIGLVAGCAKQETTEPSPTVDAAATATTTTAEEAATAEQAAPADSSYADEIRAWQEDRRTRLQAEDGWLSLVGLDWLKPGDNMLGSAPTNDIILPEKVAPVVGLVHFEPATAEDGPKIRFTPEQDAAVTLNGKKLTEAVMMTPDTGESPTVLQIGTVRFHAIVRGERVGIRVKDSDAPTRVNFKGLDYFPIDEKWRVDAQFDPYEPPKSVLIANMIGSESSEPSPGAIVFKHGGKTYRLDVLDGGEDEYFVIFSDRTTGKETYGAGRYLYARKAGPNGRMVIDFNKAYNPPCAFTEFATCPLPPRQNRLPFRVEAGELKYAGSEH